MKKYISKETYLKTAVNFEQFKQYFNFKVILIFNYQIHVDTK